MLQNSYPARKREKTASRDASEFYRRFQSPSTDLETRPVKPLELDRLYCGDSRSMPQVADNSVALVCTSPPYFVGKEYETDSSSFSDYLTMLEAVLAESFRVLEPGGRIAVNVASIGRKPFRPLPAYVMKMLEGLGFLLRGEICWLKPRSVSSCAWGSYRSAANPVLRDTAERIIIASKGRFDRALSKTERAEQGFPHEDTIAADDFVECSLAEWHIQPVSAQHIGHPAPFPVEIPRRLIEFYTYRGDLVLDPFIGSGTTAVAAVATERHWLGFDLEADYLEIAKKRIAAARIRQLHLDL